MKQILALLIALTMVFSLAACGQNNDTENPSDSPVLENPDNAANDEQEDEGAIDDPPIPDDGDDEDDALNSLADIMAQIVDGVENLPETNNVSVSAGMFESYLFIPYADGYEAVANEAMISVSAHSAVLLHVPSGTDIEAVAADIEENANPNKWICVRAEKTIVTINGDYILFVMSSEAIATAFTENFSNLSL